MTPISSSNTLLMATNVSKTFHRAGTVKALDSVSFFVNESEKVGLVGPSGSGKSTLARVVSRLETPDEGRVEFNGASYPESRRRIQDDTWLSLQMVFQNPEASFSPMMTIGAGIREGLAYRKGQTRQQQRKQVLDALEAVELPKGAADKHAFELSGGECQRAAIARAIIGNPKLIICDEATSSLDVTIQAKIMDLLQRLHEERHISFLFISHNLPLVCQFCDRVYKMEHGSLTGEYQPTLQH